MQKSNYIYKTAEWYKEQTAIICGAATIFMAVFVPLDLARQIKSTDKTFTVKFHVILGLIIV